MNHHYITAKTWGRAKADYIQWKEAKDMQEMERQAKIDIERLRAEEQAVSERVWAFVPRKRA